MYKFIITAILIIEYSIVVDSKNLPQDVNNSESSEEEATISKREVLFPEDIFDNEELAPVFRRSVDAPVVEKLLKYPSSDVEETTQREMPSKYNLKRKRSLPKSRVNRRFVQDRFTGGIVFDPWMGRL
ncbi:unnamed protein product [Phyllotreta striolata]|uniref:Uncharacterized protein n=1 Tax=Phyllotreta striolata TaxID=444603 RepID=A0A9N9XMP1_PHYSR|nr:unnamed protein product [Phyllotreta striolata]